MNIQMTPEELETVLKKHFEWIRQDVVRQCDDILNSEQTDFIKNCFINLEDEHQTQHFIN